MTLQGVSHRLMTQTQRCGYDESQLWLLQFPQHTATRYVGVHVVLCTIGSRFDCKVNANVFFWSGQPVPDHSVGLPQESPWPSYTYITVRFSVYLESDGAEQFGPSVSMLDARKQAAFQDSRRAEPQTAGGTDPTEVNGGCVLFWAGAATSSVFPCPLQYTALIAASVRISWGKTNPRNSSVIHVRLVLSDWRSCSHHSDNVHTSVLRMCFQERKKRVNYVHEGSHFWPRFKHEFPA